MRARQATDGRPGAISPLQRYELAGARDQYLDPMNGREASDSQATRGDRRARIGTQLDVIQLSRVRPDAELPALEQVQRFLPATFGPQPDEVDVRPEGSSRVAGVGQFHEES